MGGPAGTNASLIAAALGGPVLANLFAPEGQELSSFEGNTNLDPHATLGEARDMLNAISQIAMGRVNQPVSLPSSVAQQPGSYTGGGLPMPIGLVASDPALQNPSLLSLSPFGDVSRLISDRSDPPRGTGDEPPSDGGGGDGIPNIGGPREGESGPFRSGPRRRSEGSGLVRAADLMAEGSQADDLEQAMGAVELLMQSMRTPRPQAGSLY